jgi:hypothetical protein
MYANVSTALRFRHTSVCLNRKAVRHIERTVITLATHQGMRRITISYTADKL